MPAAFKSNVKTKKGQDNLLNLARCILKTIAHLELFGYNWNLLERGWEELLTRYSKDCAAAVLRFIRVPQHFCLWVLFFPTEQSLCDEEDAPSFFQRFSSSVFCSFKGLVAQSVSETPPLCSLPKTVNSYVRKQSNFFFVCLLLNVYWFIWLHRILVPLSGMEPGPPALGAQSLSHWTTREVSTLFVE